MKKFVIIGLLFLLFGFKNPNNNDTPIIIHFEQILNKYRYSNGLNTIVIDESIKEFADERSRNIVQDYSHNGAKEKLHLYNLYPKSGGENIAKVLNLPVNKKPYYSSNIKEVGDIMNKMSMGTSTNYDVAMYCFLLWKNSKSHNDLLLNPKIKRFYLSYEKSKTFYYFCFIGLD
jgi:uncharacterized protein YkwD